MRQTEKRSIINIEIKHKKAEIFIWDMFLKSVLNLTTKS